MSATERWLPVVGFEGFYEVSDMGRVRSVDRMVKMGLCGQQRRPSRFISLCLDTYGYPICVLYRNRVRRTRTVHQLVLEAFVCPRPLGMQCCHGDGDRANNRLSNLRWGTASDNASDRDKHGKTCRGKDHWVKREPNRFLELTQAKGRANHATGERAGGAKLTPDQVVAIRASYQRGKNGFTLKDIAEKYKVNVSTIHDIVTGRTWRGVA